MKLGEKRILRSKEKTSIRLITYSTVFTILLGIVTHPPHYPQEQQLQQASATSIKTKVDLVIEGLSVSKSPTGLIVVNGTVHNNSTMSVNNVEVKVELFDINNMLIRETSRFVTPPMSTFGPEQEQPFRFLIIAEGVDHHNVTAYGIT